VVSRTDQENTKMGPKLSAFFPDKAMVRIDGSPPGFRSEFVCSCIG